MIKWIINKRYKNSPKCFCGYRMKPTNDRGIVENSWKCVFTNECGWEVYETINGKLHWSKKKLKKNENKA